MPVEIIYIKIIGAAVASVILGFLWYHPRVFGALWMRGARITPEMTERGKRRGYLYTFVAFLGSAMAAYVLYSLLVLLQISEIMPALALAFVVWTGFTATTSLGIVLWEQRALSQYVINTLYWLVVFSAMSVILVL